MKALVIHPWFPVFGGGELLCLYVLKTLQEEGYETSLVTDVCDPPKAEQIYGMGSVLKNTSHVEIPEFQPHGTGIPGLNLYAIQRILHNYKIKKMIKDYEADIVFSTQSSIFLLRDVPAYHFLYNITDLFGYPAALSLQALQAYFGKVKGIGWQWRAYYWGLGRLRDIMLGDPKPRRFIALSQRVLDDLRARGVSNSSLMMPPARLEFFPRSKKKEVVTVCRLVPPKRLEDYFEIARRLPEYRFKLLGRDSPDLRNLYRGYSTSLLAKKPSNVEYVEAPLKEKPEILEESQVYLYTGVEPGVGIAMMEATGAGCIPISPGIGGGSEVVDNLGAGYTYMNLEEATNNVRIALENPCWSPIDLRQRALKVFSPDIFQSNIRKLLY